MGPEALAQVLRPLTIQAVPAELLVGINAVDDAAVYRVNDSQAVISTADFFPPVVDDPYAFGAIAAANAMSDVYAMGGQVLMAINLVAWPDDLEPAILSEILRGGADTVAQAGAVIAGGHTVTDKEPKYGLAVTGMVHPDHILTKGGAQPGDYLVLGKPLGTGLITTAHKFDKVEAGDLDVALQSMKQLNLRPSQALLLLRHARHYAELGCITGGARRNETYLSPHVHIDERLDQFDRELLWDPQTSGGLFAAIDPKIWPTLAALDPEVTFWRIGEVTARVEDEAKVVLEVY